MPKKRQTAKNKKKKKTNRGGKKKESLQPSDRKKEEDEVEADDDEEDEVVEYGEEPLANAFMAASTGQGADLTNEQGDAFEVKNESVLTDPNNPACDGCSKPFSGTMKCSKCDSVFYCGRDCQVSHWAAGHKTECALLKKKNEETAQRVLRDFKELRDWEDLDGCGAYDVAVRLGLHDKIRKVLELDKVDIVDRFKDRNQNFICYVRFVMGTLFRGDRAEGRPQTCSPYITCVDGRRVKGYVKSHPDALDVWLQASLQVLRDVANPAVMRTPRLYSTAQEVAHFVWYGWYFVFKSPTATRAILKPFVASSGAATSDGGRMRRADHVRRILQVFGEAIRLVEVISLDKLEVLPTQATAAVLVRIEEYGFGADIDVESTLNLNATQKRDLLLRKVTVKRQYDKGGALNQQEGDAAADMANRLWEVRGRTGQNVLYRTTDANKVNKRNTANNVARGK